MLNVNQITSRLSKMPDQALKQFAQMHRDDPYTVSLAISESNRRKEIRAGGQQQAQQQPKVADVAIAQMDAPQQNTLPEQQGIGALPAPNMQGMASGGIVAFDRGGRTGDVGAMQYRKYATDRAQELGLDPSFVNAIFTYESGYKPNAKSPTGPIGIGQLTAATGEAYGVSKEDRKDPYKNMDASLKFMVDLKKKYNGDQQKMAVAYNQGEPFLDSHLKQNGGQLVPQKLSKKEPITYLQRVGQIMSAAIPSAQAVELPQAPAQVAPQTAQVAPQAAAQTQVNPQGRFPLPVRTSGSPQAPEGGTTGEVDRSVLGQLKRIYGGMGTAGERIAPKEQIIGPNGLPVEDTRGFFERAATNVGIPQEVQRNVSNTLNAFSGYAAPLKIPKAMSTLSAAEKAAAAARLAKNAQASEAAAAAAAKVANVRLPPTVSTTQGGVAALSKEDQIRRGLDTPVPVPPKPTAGIQALSDADKAKRGFTTQGANFPLSQEAIEMNRRIAAARAGQKAAPVVEEAGAAGKTYPLGAEAAEMNQKLAAAKNAQALRNLKADEQAAVNAAKIAEETKVATGAEKGLEAINAVQKANKINQAVKPLNAAVDAARTGNAVSIIGDGLQTGGAEQAAPVVVPSDIDRERDSLQRRYPITERAEPAPQQDDMAREMASLQNRYPAPPSSPKEIIKMAKEETPKSAATKGFTSDDWLNLGFNLLAGKSQYAMENLGTAGVATLAAKREREKEERTAALTEAIHTPEAERAINRLMQEKGLDYAAALEFYYKNKNYIDTRMYGYDRAAASRETVADTQAGSRKDVANTVAGSKDAALIEQRKRDFSEANSKFDKDNAMLKLTNPGQFNSKKQQEVYLIYPEFAGQGGGTSSVLPNSKIVGVKPSP